MSPERSLRVKNRMRVIRTSGSVRGGDGNIPAYSARGQLDAVGAQSFEAGITVDLNDTLELLQVSSRPFGPTVSEYSSPSASLGSKSNRARRTSWRP